MLALDISLAKGKRSVLYQNCQKKKKKIKVQFSPKIYLLTKIISFQASLYHQIMFKSQDT